MRGANFPIDSKTNYFLLLEAGTNGITKFTGDSAVAATDASVTLNHIPHARVRIGQFKYPGEEEGLQAIHVFNYINFTAVTDQLLLERFFDGDGSNTQDENKPSWIRCVSRHRYPGVRLVRLAGLRAHLRCHGRQR